MMSESGERGWPTGGDTAFGPGSSSEWRSPTLVCLDWFGVLDDEATIAKGFKEAADKVVEDLVREKSQFHPDKFLFPVAYLYRHGLELTFKKLISDGVNLGLTVKDEKLEGIMRDHNLHKLWNRARQILEAYWPDADPTPLLAVEQIILQFHQLDKSGQAFRYSRTKDGHPHLEDAPTRIDLSELRRVAGKAFSFLDGCCMAFDDELDARNEIRPNT